MLANRIPALATPALGVAEDIDRLFSQLTWGPKNGAPVAPLAVWEDDGHFGLEVEMPGITQDELELVLHQGVIRIAGTRKEPEGRLYRYDERRYGRFERAVRLPESVDPDSVQAELKDGILRIALSKKAEAQPRRVPVQVG